MSAALASRSTVTAADTAHRVGTPSVWVRHSAALSRTRAVDSTPRMAHYASSTQRRCWTFDAPALAAVRAGKYAAAQVRRELGVVAAAATDEAAAAGGELQSSAKRRRVLPPDEDAPAPAADGAPLSLADELALQRHFEREALRLCKAAGFDRAILATAVMALKRLYLSAAPTELPPSEMLCVGCARWAGRLRGAARAAGNATGSRGQPRGARGHAHTHG